MDSITLERPLSKNHLLTGKQVEFVNWYCSPDVYPNASEAARRAGYRGREDTVRASGRKNLNKPWVQSAINERMSAIRESNRKTPEDILAEIELTFQLAIRDQKYSTAIRCLELQGKYLGMWSNRASNQPIQMEVSIQELSVNELTLLMDGILKASPTVSDQLAQIICKQCSIRNN